MIDGNFERLKESLETAIVTLDLQKETLEMCKSVLASAQKVNLDESTNADIRKTVDIAAAIVDSQTKICAELEELIATETDV